MTYLRAEPAICINDKETRMASDGQKVARDSHVHEELNILGDSLVKLGNVIVSLDERLRPVLTDVKEEEQKPPTTARCMVPLAETIRSYRFRIEELTNNVESIHRRCEL